MSHNKCIYIYTVILLYMYHAYTPCCIYIHKQMYIYMYQTFHRICSSPARLRRLALVAGPYLFQRQKSSNICFKRKNHGKPLGNHGFENQSFELFASVNFFHIVWPVFTIAFGKRSDQYRAGSVMDTVFCWVFCGPNHHVSPTQHLELLHQKRTKLFCKRTEWTCPFAGVFFNLFFN